MTQSKEVWPWERFAKRRAVPTDLLMDVDKEIRFNVPDLDGPGVRVFYSLSSFDKNKTCFVWSVRDQKLDVITVEWVQ